MSPSFEIKNKVAESGLVNFDLSLLIPKGKRIGLDLKEFLSEGNILREKEFREKVKNINPEEYKDAFVYIYNSVEAIVPIWAYFLLSSQLSKVTKKLVLGSKEDLEMLLMHQALQGYDFSELSEKRVLVKGCTDQIIPQNAYIELMEQLRPIVKSLMFGEACSNVPIFKN